MRDITERGHMKELEPNTTGLVMYNPKNAAEMLKSMKNKSQSRDQKIALRRIYDQQSQQ